MAPDLVELDAIMDSNASATIRQRGAHPVPAGAPRRPQLVHHRVRGRGDAGHLRGVQRRADPPFHRVLPRDVHDLAAAYHVPTRLLRCPTIDQCDQLGAARQSAAGATTKLIIQAIYDKFPNAVLNYGWGRVGKRRRQQPLKITRAMLEGRFAPAGERGRPMKHVEMKVVDEDGNEVPDGEVGEALFRSRSVMQGYYGQPDPDRRGRSRPTAGCARAT